MSWIKVRTELPSSVKILKLQRILGCSRMEAVGLAVSWFAWVDAHCDNEVTHLALPDFQELLCPANASSVTQIGNAGSVTEHFCVGNASGITANASSVTRDNVFVAFKSVGWIDIDENGEVLIVDFEKHNGENAKRRVQNAKRVAKHKANASSVTKNEENAKPLTQVALPREDKIREDKNNNNLSISLRGTSNQSNYDNNNTTVLSDVKSEISGNALKTAFSTSDDKMFGTREKTSNNGYSVANTSNSAKPRTSNPCTIVEVMNFMNTFFPALTEEQKASIAQDFFVQNSQAGWLGVTNWKLSLQSHIQSLTISV